MAANYCPYCWPIKRRSHQALQLDYYMNRLLPSRWFIKPVHSLQSRWQSQRSNKIYQNTAWNLLLELLHWFGLVRFTDQPDRSQLQARSLIFFDEARNRGLNITTAIMFGRKYTNDFKFSYGRRTYYYEGIPITMHTPFLDIDNKIKTKKFLHSQGIPVAQGEIFTSLRKGLAYAKNLGFPLVVKPNNGSLSNHVTCFIRNEHQLEEAIAIARQYNPAFIIEKCVSGEVFRASVVGQAEVFVAQRDRANVVGNGLQTIAELLQEKNNQPGRAEPFARSATIHQVPVDELTNQFLREQGLTWQTIPQAGQKIYLYSDKKYIPDRGNDIINYTSQVHPENIKLFLRVAKLLGTDLVGIDFISPDITRPYHEQITAVLETNSLPFIDMHQAPSHGPAEPVAKIVWDMVLQRLASRNLA